MAGKWHNRGLVNVLKWLFQGAAMPTNIYLTFSTAARTPDPDDNLLASPIIEVAAGNGFSAGGILLNRNSTDFVSATQDDVNNRGSIAVKTLTFTPSGGPFPSDAVGARWAHLTTDEGTISNRQLIVTFDLFVPVVVSDGQGLTISTATARIAGI